MLKTVHYTIFIIYTLFSIQMAFAQADETVIYSPPGMGELSSLCFPQNGGMGGISMGIRKLGNYQTLNVSNPASYSGIALSTFDMGIITRVQGLEKKNLGQGGETDVNFNYVVFGFPINKRSAFSFGLLPYNYMKYHYTTSSSINTTVGNNVTLKNLIYRGDGGVSKVYLGYSYLITPSLSIGGNFSYLFGKLIQSRLIEFPNEHQARSVQDQITNHLSGVNLDYGLQYIVGEVAKKYKVIVGYTGSFANKLNSENTIQRTTYSKNSSPLSSTTEVSMLWKMPTKHVFGFTVEKTNKFLVGLDLSYCRWENFRFGNETSKLNNSCGIALGAQVTPDATSVSGYFKSVDYRLGFKYDRTYVPIEPYDINQYAVTLGLGFPLSVNRFTIHKINFATEIGAINTLNSDLIQENYIKLSLGFMVNDKWFIKPKLE